MKYSDVEVRPLAKNRYEILKAITYKDVTVPRGYRTNGANVPRVLWWYIPPNKSDILPAVIIHDYLCDLEEYAKADKCFDEIMVTLGVKPIYYYPIIKTVELWHKVAYKANNSPRSWYKLYLKMRG